MTFGKLTCGVLGLAAMAAIVALPPIARTAAAQTASDLKCKGCVGKSDIGKKAVTKKALKKKAVRAKHIKPNALRAKHIADGQVLPAALAPSAKPAAGGFAGGYQNLTLTGTAAVVRSVTVTAPSAGLAMVTASGYIYADAVGLQAARCSITTGAAVDTTYLIYLQYTAGGIGDTDAFGATRGFAVGAGPNTFNLVCDELSGALRILATQMTAIYVPQEN